MTTMMASEIAEQPEVVSRTLAALAPVRERIPELFAGRTRVLFAARGSSDNAAVYGRYLLEVHARVNAGLASPSLATHYGVELDLRDALVVCVSQSGSTAEIAQVERWARSCGAATVAVTNVADSPLAQAADLALVTAAGPEVAVPATKTYLAQLVAMATLAQSLSREPEVLAGHLSRVAPEVERLIRERAGVTEAVAALVESRWVVASGRGLLLGTALETALKIEETCMRPVRGYSYADLRHGPISVIGEQVTAILVAAEDGPLAPAMTDLADDLGQRGARTVGIGGDDAFARSVDIHVPGPRLTELVAPLGLIVPAQLIVEELARALHLDPDSPPGLRKVTQTDAQSDTGS